MARYPSVFSGGGSSDAMVFWNTGATPSGFFFQSLVTGVYFDSIRLDNPEPFWEDRSPAISITDLLSGKVSVQSSPEGTVRPIKISFKCHTSSHSNIDQLREKIGGAYALIIDEYTYENCHISSFKELEWFEGKFEFEISFVQDTT